ncbi:ras-related protein Rab-3C [Phaethornis superciliosus]
MGSGSGVFPLGWVPGSGKRGSVVAATPPLQLWMASTQDSRYVQKDTSEQNFDYMFKLLIIGNSSVGKTSFLFRYADDSFTSAFVSTVGIDFKVKTVFKNEKRIKLQIWVLEGGYRVSPDLSLLHSEQHEVSQPVFIGEGAPAIIFLTFLWTHFKTSLSFFCWGFQNWTKYSKWGFTNVEYRGNITSLDLLAMRLLVQLRIWSTQIKTYSWDNAQVILVGNKCDMEDERVIFTERGKHLAEQLGFEFFETSAKDNINVKQTFERLVDIICDKMLESLEVDSTIAASKQNTRLKDTPPPQQPNCGC